MKGPSKVATCLILTGLIVGPTPVFGQPSSAESVFSALVLGDDVRLAAPGLDIDLGTVTVLTEDSILVAGDGQEWWVDSRLIQRLEVRQNQAIRFGLGGLIFGAGFGAAVEYFLVTGQCGHKKCPGAYAQSALVGGGAFGLAGFAIGRRAQRWEFVIR